LPEEKKEGAGLAIGLVAATGIGLALVLLWATQAKAPPPPPSTKRSTFIKNYLVQYAPTDGSYRYIFAGFLYDVLTGQGIPGKTVKEYVLPQGSTSWVEIDSYITSSSQGWVGFFDLGYEPGGTYPKPRVQAFKARFEGDSQYEASELVATFNDVTPF